MVTCRGDAGDTVDTSRKASRNVGSQDTVHGSSVETLEESEDLGVQGLRRVERRHLLYGNMAVTLDVTADQLLRSRKVSVVRVRERSGTEVVDRKGDGEWGVGGDGTEIRGGGELGGRLSVTCQTSSRKDKTRPYHVVNRRDIAHGGRVARTCLVLLTIGNSLADAETNEVVPGGF